MEIESEGEGGVAEILLDADVQTKLSAFRESDHIRVALTSRDRDGEIALSMGLNADEARDLGWELLAHATLLDSEE